MDSSFKGMSIWIDFDGIYRNSDIWINGQYLGNHASGYTSFRWYIDQMPLNYGGGDNVLAVRVDVCASSFYLEFCQTLYHSRFNTYESSMLWGNCSQHTMKDVCHIPDLLIILAHFENIYSFIAVSRSCSMFYVNTGWYEGGGIYRHVWLNVANPIHIKPWGVYAGNNVTMVSSNGRFGNAMLNVQTNLTYNSTSGTSQTVSLQTDVISKSTGEKVATNTKTGVSMVAGKEVLITQTFASLENVLLWSIANPELYYIYSTLLDSDGNIIDSVDTKFGFRKVYFDVNGGLYLNDEYVKMTGFCNHQDFAGCGVAMPDRVNRFRVEHLQEMGANSWRMSHNPPNPELLDFADEYGLLVWDENRNFANNTQYLQDQADMINRDKNHPSVIIWSLCNEGGCMEGSANGGNVGKMFEAIIHRIDNVNTRKISAGLKHLFSESMSS